MTDRRIAKLRQKIADSRRRLCIRCPEFAAPLFDVIFVAADVYRISTNGVCIYFDPGWLEKLGSESTDFALCHQLMHISSDHFSRPQLYAGERFHLACNIVADSALEKYGFTAGSLPGIGAIRRETFFPKVAGSKLTPYDAFRMTPLDPASMSESQRKKIVTDSDEFWDRRDDRGECGTVVLSPGAEVPGEALPPDIAARIKAAKGAGVLPVKKKRKEYADSDDGCDLTIEYAESAPVSDTIKELRSIKNVYEEEAGEYALTERVIAPAGKVTNDWRTLLNHFIMEETFDYSFTPPDRRFDATGFFLPEYNRSETERQNVLFMIDVSGSVTDSQVAAAIAELSAAVEQFGGCLEGRVGTFDTRVYGTVSLSEWRSLLKSGVKRGGGTDFRCIFDYAKNAERLSEIVILSDGKGDFPDHEETRGIPVLWLLTSDAVRVPWGHCAYFARRF